jgi:hypothetical protein
MPCRFESKGMASLQKKKKKKISLIRTYFCNRIKSIFFLVYFFCWHAYLYKKKKKKISRIFFFYHRKGSMLIMQFLSFNTEEKIHFLSFFFFFFKKISRKKNKLFEGLQKKVKFTLGKISMLNILTAASIFKYLIHLCSAFVDLAIAARAYLWIIGSLIPLMQSL